MNMPKYFSQWSDEEIKQNHPLPRMPLGIPKLDAKFDFPSGFYVVVGYPGAGKSWLATWLIRRGWEKHGRKGVYITLEVSMEPAKRRILQQWSDLTQERLEAGASTTQAIHLLKQDSIAIEDFTQTDKGIDVSEFKKLFEKHYQAGFRIFCFDHFHELPGAEDMKQNAVVADEWGTCFRELRKTYEDVWLFVFAQPNDEGTRAKIIKRYHLKGSRPLMQKADYFLSLNPKQQDDDAVEQEDRSVLLYLDKNRNTSSNHVGFWMYFAKTANFFATAEDQLESTFDYAKEWND